MNLSSRQSRAIYDANVKHRINAGRIAVREQIAFFSRQFGQIASEWKKDDTRVTFADFAIAERVSASLRRDFSEDIFCSEEANPLDEILELNSEFAWIIDPIDGTNNFALGFPICSISLALLYNGEPIYGFIYDHGTGKLYEGGCGYGVRTNSQKIKRDQLVANAQVMLGLHFPMTNSQLVGLIPMMKKYRCRCIGSGALTATYVATGYLSGSIDYRVKVWDIAAAYALCKAVKVEFHFLKKPPFPLKKFHPNMDFCPYYAGTNAFCKELATSLKIQNIY
ncbi:MAG: inositol monophosphatase [Verrucomicrobiota bacterium]|nr:inositol monophosphatase [Verrucomicrobiota bacterium]